MVKVGTGSFPGVKRPGLGADHPTPSKCRGHERVVGLYLYSPSGPSWPVIGRTLLVMVKVKVKFTLEQTTKAQKSTRGIPVLFL